MNIKINFGPFFAPLGNWGSKKNKIEKFQDITLPDWEVTDNVPGVTNCRNSSSTSERQMIVKWKTEV